MQWMLGDGLKPLTQRDHFYRHNELHTGRLRFEMVCNAIVYQFEIPIDRRLGWNEWLHRSVAAILPLLFLVFASGCATVQLSEARKEFYSLKPDKAAEILLSQESVSGRDELLVLMDRGLVLHHIGRYAESTKSLLKAAELIDSQEMIRAGEQLGSLVTTEWLTSYKGEYSERLWVHTYLMMNYLLLGQFDSAYVEARKSLEYLAIYPEPLLNDYFTQALIALCFENVYELNDAYIVYKKLFASIDDPFVIAPYLYRTGRLLGFNDELSDYQGFLTVENSPVFQDQYESELVLFIGEGQVPIKEPGNIIIPPATRFSFPVYAETDIGHRPIDVFLNGSRQSAIRIRSDFGEISRAALDERKAKVIAKETARVIAKEAIAKQLEDNNGSLVGGLVRIAFFLLEEPDTRSWETLPAHLSMIRIPLHPGSHQLQIRFKDPFGYIVRTMDLPEVHLSAGERIYKSIRVFH